MYTKPNYLETPNTHITEEKLSRQQVDAITKQCHKMHDEAIIGYFTYLITSCTNIFKQLRRSLKGKQILKPQSA